MNKIINGKSEDKLKEIDDNSVDLICTDPPYALVSGQYQGDGEHKKGFMSKEWDAQLPSIESCQECYRVLKPGAFMFWMSSPRQDVLSHMIIRLADVGFRTDFTSLYWVYAQGVPKAHNVGKSLESKSHEKANELKGTYAGYQPKPAVEIIIVVSKPIVEKTHTKQAIANGKGVTWLDDVRIPAEDYEEGRFPSNLVVSNQEDGFAKFFSLDLWWKDKSKDLPDEIKESLPCIPVPKASPSEKNQGCEDMKTVRECRWNNAGVWQNLETEQYGNVHPTVKPLDLMSYLIMLGSDKEDVILDPFVGSGTTCMAAFLLGRKYIGIEIDETHYKIA